VSLKILPSLLNRHAELSKELDGINEVIDKEIVALAKKLFGHAIFWEEEIDWEARVKSVAAPESNWLEWQVSWSHEDPKWQVSWSHEDPNIHVLDRKRRPNTHILWEGASVDLYRKVPKAIFLDNSLLEPARKAFQKREADALARREAEREIVDERIAKALAKLTPEELVALGLK